MRGARNYPCMDKPGKRAPTVEICKSDKPYMPLAMRQHVLGPSPLDPNLLSQGIPPDDRVTSDKRIFGPVEGTPLPPGAVPRGTPPGPRGTYGPPGPGYAAPPVPSSASMSTQSADFPPIAPLDVPAPGEVSQPATVPAPAPVPSPPDKVNDDQPRAAPSSFAPKAVRPATGRSRRHNTIRVPVDMSVATATYISSRDLVKPDRGQNVAGHAAHLKPGARTPDQPILSSRTGISTVSHWFWPHAPLGPIVLSLPASVGDPIMHRTASVRVDGIEE